MGQSTSDRTCGSRTCDGRLPPGLPSGTGGRHAAAFKRRPATGSASSRPTACGPLRRVPGFWGTGCAWTARWPAAPWLRANGGPRQPPRPSLPENLRSSRLELWPRLAFDAGCWTVARSGGRRLLQTTFPALWDSGPVKGSPQGGCFSRRGARRRHPATTRRGGRLPRPAWAAALGNGIPGPCAASGPRRRPSGWTDPGARSARRPQELPARLPDRPWRCCHDADRGCTIEEP